MKKPPKEIHIGERIKEVFDKGNLSISQFADLLHCDRTNVYDIFRRKKIDLRLLWEISAALNHNFIEELCAYYGFSKGLPSSKISLVLEIGSMDANMLDKLLKTIGQMDVRAVREGGDV